MADAVLVRRNTTPQQKGTAMATTTQVGSPNGTDTATVLIVAIVTAVALLLLGCGCVLAQHQHRLRAAGNTGKSPFSSASSSNAFRAPGAFLLHKQWMPVLLQCCHFFGQRTSY